MEEFMSPLLTTDVPKLGEAGDIVDVKAGYGANYLLPKGLALTATTGNKAKIAHQRRVR